MASARVAALVLPPRMHLTRFHGGFAPHSRLRAAVTPARRGMGAAKPPVAHHPPTPRHVAMSWAQRLKRVFGIEIDTCQRCCGTLRIIASIEPPEPIAKILAHLERAAPSQPKQPEVSLGARAPPVQAACCDLEATPIVLATAAAAAMPGAAAAGTVRRDGVTPR